MLRFMLGSLLFGAVLAQAAPAAAADPVLPSPAVAAPQQVTAKDNGTRSNWYGWQTIAVGGSSLGLMGLGRTQDSIVLGGVGTAGYLIGSPIVHLAHRQYWKSGASLGLNVVLPIAFASLIPGGCDERHDDGHKTCDFNMRALITPGLLVGSALAVGIDAAVLGHERVQREAPPRSRKVEVLPVAAAGPNGAFVGVNGRF
jgi:hypothetical protein